MATTIGELKEYGLTIKDILGDKKLKKLVNTCSIADLCGEHSLTPEDIAEMAKIYVQETPKGPEINLEDFGFTKEEIAAMKAKYGKSACREYETRSDVEILESVYDGGTV